jgi:toxin ParE1/3/4
VGSTPQRMRAYTLFRSARAEEDLIEIWSHIAFDSLAAADRLLDAIEARWQLLATQPRSGALRGDLGSDIRQVVVGNYLTFYRVDGQQIVILRVMHGKRGIDPDDLGG